MSDFDNNFEVDQSLMSAYYTFANKQAGQKINRLSRTLEDDLKVYIKATIARQLWSENGFFTVLNSNDPTVHKAIELVNSEGMISLLNPEKN